MLASKYTARRMLFRAEEKNKGSPEVQGVRGRLTLLYRPVGRPDWRPTISSRTSRK